MTIATFPANKPFITQLAQYVALTEYRGLLLLPSKRSCLSLSKLLHKQGANLPQIIALGELVDHPYAINILKQRGKTDLALPAISSTKRQLMLARICMATAHRQGGAVLPTSQAMDLASALALLLDEFQRQEADITNIDTLAPDEYALHWQQVLQFLGIIAKEWPRILEAEQLLDPVTRRNAIYQELHQHWHQHCRQQGLGQGVMIAGSTGSNKAIARLMRFVAAQENGQVILPALPTDCDAEYWDSIGASHPHFYTKRFLMDAKIKLGDVELIESHVAESCTASRSEFIHQSLAPANLAHRWQQQKPPYNLDGFTFIGSKNELEQVREVTLICQQLLGEGKSICIVSERKFFTKLLGIALKSAGIDFDASEGGDLKENNWALWFNLVLAAAQQPLSPAHMLALLKHPQQQTEEVFWLEKHVLRTGRTYRHIQHLLQSTQAIESDYTAQTIEMLEYYWQAIEPLSLLLQQSFADLGQLLKAHKTCMEALTTDANYAAADKVVFDEFLTHLEQQASYLGQIDTHSYPAIIDKLLASEHSAEATAKESKLRILPSEEARLETANAVIIVDFNESVWPADEAANPWLSRAMQTNLGMGFGHMRASRMAHDFIMLSHASQLFLTRSKSDEASAILPSRWQQRMTFHLLANQQISSGAELEDTSYKELLHNAAYHGATFPINRPSAAPPLANRPTNFSISDFELLQRDPYSIYAKHVLKLRPVEELTTNNMQAVYGTVLHKVLELFCRKYPKQLPENALQELESIAQDTLHAFQVDKNLYALWRPRIKATMEHYYHTELERRSIIDKVQSEVKVSARLDIKGKEHQIYGRIDRMEHYPNGTAAIIDYKTGNLPLVREVKDFTAPQLAMSAWLAQAKYHTPIDKVEYWRLAADECLTKPQLSEMQGEQTIDKIEQHIKQVLEHYADEDTAYLAIPDPVIAPKYSNYEHLERVAEWT